MGFGGSISIGVLCRHFGEFPPRLMSLSYQSLRHFKKTICGLPGDLLVMPPVGGPKRESRQFLLSSSLRHSGLGFSLCVDDPRRVLGAEYLYWNQPEALRGY